MSEVLSGYANYSIPLNNLVFDMDVRLQAPPLALAPARKRAQWASLARTGAYLIFARNFFTLITPSPPFLEQVLRVQ